MLASSCNDGAVRVHKPFEGSPCKALRGHKSSVNVVAWSPDGRFLATGSSATVRLWDVATGALVRVIQEGGGKEVNSVAWSPDGSLLATTSYHDNCRLWDATAGCHRCMWWLYDDDEHKYNIKSVAWSPCSRVLFAGDKHGAVHVLRIRED